MGKKGKKQLSHGNKCFSAPYSMEFTNTPITSLNHVILNVYIYLIFVDIFVSHLKRRYVFLDAT